MVNTSETLRSSLQGFFTLLLKWNVIRGRPPSIGSHYSIYLINRILFILIKRPPLTSIYRLKHAIYSFRLSLQWYDPALTCRKPASVFRILCKFNAILKFIKLFVIFTAVFVYHKIKHHFVFHNILWKRFCRIIRSFPRHLSPCFLFSSWQIFIKSSYFPASTVAWNKGTFAIAILKHYLSSADTNAGCVARFKFKFEFIWFDLFIKPIRIDLFLNESLICFFHTSKRRFSDRKHILFSHFFKLPLLSVFEINVCNISSFLFKVYFCIFGMKCTNDISLGCNVFVFFCDSW